MDNDTKKNISVYDKFGVG